MFGGNTCASPCIQRRDDQQIPTCGDFDLAAIDQRMCIALGVGCGLVEGGCAGRGFDVANQPLPRTALAIAKDRAGKRYGAI